MLSDMRSMRDVQTSRDTIQQGRYTVFVVMYGMVQLSIENDNEYNLVPDLGGRRGHSPHPFGLSRN